MTKLQIALFCLSILIIKSNTSPIDESRSNDEKRLSRSKLSNDDTLKTYMASKSPKFKLSDAQAVKLLDPNIRAALSQILTEANIERQKAAVNDDDSSSTSSKSVQSLYPKCDDAEDDSDEENKLVKESKFQPLYYDIKSSLIGNPSNTIFKSNLRVYLKKSVHDCDCKADADDDLLQLSLYETSSIVSFHPVKEVPKRQLIESVKFNRCCDQLITFDLTQQAQKWKTYPESNKGLQLKLTDNQGNMLNVDDYIQLMNCSDKSIPMPYVKMLYPKLSGILKHLKQPQYPTLDVAYNRNDNLFAIKNSQQLMDDDKADKDANV